MKTMILNELCGLEENQAPLELTELPDPNPSVNEILIRVSACGPGHTELDEIEGRTHPPCLPIVLGHQVVGRLKQPEAKLTPSELEIVSVSHGFSLSVKHASSVWQAMKIYVRITKLSLEIQMEDLPSIWK